MESFPNVEIQTTKTIEAISTKYDIVQAILAFIGCTIDELKKMNLTMLGILNVNSLRTGCDFEHISVLPFCFMVTIKDKTKTVYMAQLLDDVQEEQFINVTISSKSFNGKINKVFNDAVDLTKNATVNPVVACNMICGKSKQKEGYWLTCGTIEESIEQNKDFVYKFIPRIASMEHKNEICARYHNKLHDKISEILVIEEERAADLLAKLDESTAEFNKLLKKIK